MEKEIESKILTIKGHRAILDSDLARLYGVSTSRLNEQVTRNIRRFPNDFMFQLSLQELNNLMSQNAISSSPHGGRRKPPRVFTEYGAVMAANVLNSDVAIDASPILWYTLHDLSRPSAPTYIRNSFSYPAISTTSPTFGK
jgi:hypothetical protein